MGREETSEEGVMATFRSLTLWGIILHKLFPAKRAEYQAELREEMRRLVMDAPDEPVSFIQ